MQRRLLEFVITIPKIIERCRDLAPKLRMNEHMNIMESGAIRITCVKKSDFSSSYFKLFCNVELNWYTNYNEVRKEFVEEFNISVDWIKIFMSNYSVKEIWLKIVVPVLKVYMHKLSLEIQKHFFLKFIVVLYLLY